MGFDDLFEWDESVVDKEATKDLIKRRRLQMVYHSYIYYRMDTNIISDDQWQAWADELTQLQQDHPDCCKLDCYDKEFTGWDGATGMHLPATGHERMKAEYLVAVVEKYNASVV